MPHRAVFLTGLACAFTALALSAPPAGASTAVAIKDFSFQPASITVAPGATVTWTNQDQTEHSVTSDTGAFDSGGGLCPPAQCLAPGASYSHTFTTAGTFKYHCNIHTYMHGTVTVGTTSTPTTAAPPTTSPPPTSPPPTTRAGSPTTSPPRTATAPTATPPSLPAGAAPAAGASGESSIPPTSQASSSGGSTTVPAAGALATRAASRKAHSNTGTVVAIVVAVLVLLGAGGALWFRISTAKAAG